MYKHHILISVFGFNKLEASNKVSELLDCYDKKRYTIIAVEGTNNHYEVEIQYYDRYEKVAYFPSEDFEENNEKNVLKYKM